MTTRVTHVLAPVDFSDASHHAMHWAGLLGLRFGAKLTVAHIVPPSAAVHYVFLGDIHEFEKKVFAEANERLPREIPAACRGRLDTQAIVRAGDVRDELLGMTNRDLLNRRT